MSALDVLAASAEGWTAGARPGHHHRPLYADRDAGRFFGWIRFDAMADTGIHQHLGPAFSYFLEGGLYDYQGRVVAGQMGINFSPATHEAIAYRPTTFVARLEAPVLTLGDGEPVHTGARAGQVENARPERLPDLNVTVDSLPMVPTAYAGVGRRTVHDYLGTGFDRRCVQLQLMPDAVLPTFTTVDRLDIFMVGGSVEANGVSIGNGALASVPLGSEVAIRTRFGALFFAWSEAPVELAGPATQDPFGF